MHLRLSSLIGIFVVICAISFWFYRSTVGVPIEEEKEVVVEVSPDIVRFDEMDAFLETWSEYIYSGTSRKMSLKLSLSDKKIPADLKKWLKKHGWKDAERFFYVEQRLASIVKSVYLKRHAESTIKVLEKQLQEEENPQIADNIRKVIANQKKMAAVENVSEQEIEMVAPNVDKIYEILEGKVVYRPEIYEKQQR